MAGKGKHKSSWLADQSGAAGVLFAVLAAILVGLVALSVDVGHIGVVRTELQNAADACALAGARGFLPDVLPGTVIAPNPTTAQTTAVGWITQNAADNFVLSSLSDVQIGIWDYTTNTMAAWPDPFSIPYGSPKGPAIAVTIRKQEGLNSGPIRNAIAAIFGVPTSDAQARAVASLGGVGGFKAGSAPFPIAINQTLLSNVTVDQKIFLSPDDADVGGWTGMLGGANTSTVKSLIEGPLTYDVPSGSEISLLNGVDCALTKAIIDHYNLKDAANAVNPEKGVYQPKNLSLVAPVVTAIKYNQSAQIVGGVGFNLTEVRDSNAAEDSCTLQIQITTGLIPLGTTSGGLYYGALSPEPKLVR